MLGARMQQWWQRLRQKLGLEPKGEPVWGPEPPTILGVCSHCGAVVLKGWHQETPQGLLCRRCAGQEGYRNDAGEI